MTHHLLLGELALLLVVALLVLDPVVRFFGRELADMVCPGVATRERFGHRQHGPKAILCLHPEVANALPLASRALAKLSTPRSTEPTSSSPPASNLSAACSLFRGCFRFCGFIVGHPTFQLSLPHPFSCLRIYEPLLGRRRRSDFASGCFPPGVRPLAFHWPRAPERLKTGNCHVDLCNDRFKSQILFSYQVGLSLYERLKG